MQYLEILNALFFIAEKNGEELCVSPDGKIYAVKDRDKETASLLPLTEPAAPVVSFNPEKLIFRNDLLLRSAKIEILTAQNGTKTVQERSINGAETENITVQERSINGAKTGQQRNINGGGTVENRAVVGKGKVNLPRFSDLHGGDVAAVSVQIEALIDKAICCTNKNETIKKIISYYESAKTAAQKGNLFALKNIEKSLCGIVEKQKAMKAGVDKMQHKAEVKKTLIKCLTCAALLSVIYFYFSYNSTKVAPTPLQTAIFETDIFEEAVNEFERQTNKKIYPAGRECLRRACQNCTTKQQCLTIIKANVK